MAAAPPTIGLKPYLNVVDRATELGCNPPNGLTVLPRNFHSATSREDLLHEDTAPTLRALWVEAGIAETRLEPEGTRFPYIEENSFEWVGPTILFGSAVFIQNPHVISVTLSVLANYLTDYFKGRPNPKVKFSVVVPLPKSKKYAKLDYEGDPEGIKEISKLIKDIRNEKRKP